MNEPGPSQPEIHSFNSMAEAFDAELGRTIADNEAQGFKILDVRRVPGIPIIQIENPFADASPRQIVELPYETPEEEALVQTARDEHAKLMELHGPENILVVKPSLKVALRHGHMFPKDLLAFMVRTEPWLP